MNQTQIWYGEFNYFAFKDYNFPHTTGIISINLIHKTNSKSRKYIINQMNENLFWKLEGLQFGKWDQGLNMDSIYEKSMQVSSYSIGLFSLLIYMGEI